MKSLAENLNKSEGSDVSHLLTALNKMKRLLSFLAVLVFLGLAGPSQVQAQTSISFQVFYDTLSPYGDWVQVDDFGYCWQPRVDDGWRPYTNGYWSYTNAGWTWVANEPWGWAPYHYGRWTTLRGRWVWVPGYEWGPAWVSWRFGGSYVGWAPLPPAAVWRPSVGFGISVETNYGIAPNYYNFCQVGSFGSRYIRPSILPYRQNVNIINNTVNVTNISVQNNYVYNGGPDVNYFNRFGGNRIPRYQLERRTDFNPERMRDGFNQRRGDRLEVFAPRVSRDSNNARPSQVAYRARMEEFNRNREGVPNRPDRDQVRDRNPAPSDSRPERVDRRGEALRQQREQSVQRIEAQQREMQRRQQQQRWQAQENSGVPREQGGWSRPQQPRSQQGSSRPLPAADQNQALQEQMRRNQINQQRMMQQQRDSQQRQQIQQQRQMPSFPRPDNDGARRQQQLQRQQQQQSQERQYQQQRQQRQALQIQQQQQANQQQEERRRNQDREQRQQMQQRMNEQSGNAMRQQQEMRSQQMQQQRQQFQQRQSQMQQSQQFQQRQQQQQMRMNRQQQPQPQQ